MFVPLFDVLKEQKKKKDTEIDATRNNNNENSNNDSNNSNNHTEPFVSDDPGIVTEIQRMHA